MNLETKLTRATVVYLVDTDDGVCLAQMKKAIHRDKVERDHSSTIKNKEGEKEQEKIEYSLGAWNGYGGKEEEGDDSIKYTAIRELEEESGVKGRVEDLEFVGIVNFFLKEKSDMPFMQVYFYILRKWEGAPREGNEMGIAKFFQKDEIPYHDMMPADQILFSKMLMGEMIDSEVILLGKDVEPVVMFI